MLALVLLNTVLVFLAKFNKIRKRNKNDKHREGRSKTVFVGYDRVWRKS